MSETPETDIRVTIGTCASCISRGADRHCTSDRLVEEYSDNDGRDDQLVYSYNESGGFQVGDNFGCIHWAPKGETE